MYFSIKPRHLTLAAAAILLVSGCASAGFEADVTRFHQNYAPQADVVSIVSTDPGLAQSLEFSAYANQLGDRLGRLGFKPATPGTKATVVAEFGYTQTSISALQEAKRSPINIGIGVGGGEGNFGLGGSVNFPVGNSQQRENLTKVSTVTLRLKKVAESPVTLWEGRATSQGPSGAPEYALSAVMPKLLDALLDGFPGESGKTVHYKPTQAKK